MTDRDALAVFDSDLFAEVAGEFDLAEDRLHELARTHQENVRDLPGVDNIVYEWRNHFHRDPLLARTDESYYLALPEHVWDEFADSLGATDRELAALIAVHERQARRDSPSLGFEASRLENDEPVVLSRP